MLDTQDLQRSEVQAVVRQEEERSLGALWCFTAGGLMLVVSLVLDM